MVDSASCTKAPHSVMYSGLCQATLTLAATRRIKSDVPAVVPTGSEELNRSNLNRSLLGGRSAITTGGIATIIALAFIVASKTNKQRASTSIRPRQSMFGDQLYQCYSMAHFAAATMNFSIFNILYEGVYTIYRGGVYSFNINAYTYVIYRWTCMPDDISKLREVSHLRHPNLASMFGYCCRDGQMIVGYNNEGLGILLSHLSYSSYYNLPWHNRLNILVGAADALRCLHTANIIHGDVCAATILVDSSSRAKLVTAGSFVGHLSAHNARHRPEGLPPGIEGLTELTEKSDVYMFGLLLFIVLCGRRTNYSGGYPFLLPFVVQGAMNTNTLQLIIDMNMLEIAQSCMNMFLEVAFRCCSHEQVHRPSMDTVVEGLRRAQAFQP